MNRRKIFGALLMVFVAVTVGIKPVAAWCDTGPDAQNEYRSGDWLAITSHNTRYPCTSSSDPSSDNDPHFRAAMMTKGGEAPYYAYAKLRITVKVWSYPHDDWLDTSWIAVETMRTSPEDTNTDTDLEMVYNELTEILLDQFSASSGLAEADDAEGASSWADGHAVIVEWPVGFPALYEKGLKSVFEIILDPDGHAGKYEVRVWYTYTFYGGGWYLETHEYYKPFVYHYDPQ